MEWIACIVVLIAIVAVTMQMLASRHRRARINAGREYWQCGMDLSGCGARIDFRGDRRCPKCGELTEPDLPGKID